MAVFWMGWARKIKNIFTRTEADKLYLQKTTNELQEVTGMVDFYNNVAFKQNGYVDNVNNAQPSSIVNVGYVDVIKNDLTTKVTTNTGDITNLTTKVATNTTDITNLKIDCSGLSSSVGMLQQSVSENINSINQLKTETTQMGTDIANIVKKKFVRVATGTSAYYLNLATEEIRLDYDLSVINLDAPCYIKFKIASNSMEYHGSFFQSTQWPKTTTEVCYVGSRMFYSSQTHNMEQGQERGVSLTYINNNTFNLKYQCWDVNDRIGFVELWGWVNY